MNRKKILICLSTQDDAQLERAFIEKQLAHPQHLIMKFSLESIIRDDYAKAYAQANQQIAENTTVVLENTTQKLINVQEDLDTPVNLKNGKRQTIISSSVKELLIDSHYADILIIKSYNFYALCAYYGQKKPMQEILKKAGCPVLVIPDQPGNIEQIILIYDGTASALHAIKVLRMVLPDLCRLLPVTVLIPYSYGNDHFSAHEEKLLIEYLRLHFKDLGIHKICENSIHTIHFAIDTEKKALIVNNHPEQILPAYIAEELQALKEAQTFHYYQFLVNALPLH
ncbi:hypothetical protein [Catalinimonas niigatensis]|uniref:hypothetical protein n=1 Tax=Catalinimonas niigatensis TaxID=1397264 RepID=UPI002665D3A2|nr:hypothetical protein [Catalinimonas niigatensis]WPP52083.1 hypothetical protein PZB72_06780 [Catalinimonas niigatensis]